MDTHLFGCLSFFFFKPTNNPATSNLSLLSIVGIFDLYREHYSGGMYRIFQLPCQIHHDRMMCSRYWFPSTKIPSLVLHWLTVFGCAILLYDRPFFVCFCDCLKFVIFLRISTCLDFVRYIADCSIPTSTF